MLRVEDLVVRYGNATALDGVSLTVNAGEMVALVGPNGAGKSTLVNTLSGVLSPVSGSVQLEGTLAQVPEGRQLFADMSVADNLQLGAWRSRRRSGARDPRRVYAVLPDLERMAGQLAGTLSGGQQQMVAVGRALMADPDILAIDELSLGLAPIIVSDLVEHLRMLNAERGMAVLLIEQNARLAFDLCERAYVLEAGRITSAGTCVELARSPEVARAYLGVSGEAVTVIAAGATDAGSPVGMAGGGSA
ncbi:MAG: ABC transporter ATP-binding protein [Nakamurella sp.]